MTPRLCFLVCDNFHAEVAAAVAAEGWSDVVCAAYPAHCGRPGLTWLQVGALLPPDCTQVVMVGRACQGSLRNAGHAPSGFPPVQSVLLEQCFHMVAGPHLVAQTLAGGAYLMTPTWLADWRAKVRALGFEPELAGEFFADFAKELVFLDTGTDPDAPQRLQALAQAVPLPVRRVPVGLDTTRALLAREVLQWRLRAEQETRRDQARQHARELADHVAASDLLARLSKVQHETEAIAAIEDMLQMLFAPRFVHYQRVENGVNLPGPQLPDELRAPLALLDKAYEWTPDGGGFLLRIGHEGAVVGKVAVLGLAFPAQRARYVNMALAMTDICAVVIENARIRSKLLEAEKLASLSILVAGVAHEIATPLGVDLVATSALQGQTRRLASRFADRSMTQADLSRYLAQADEETTLIHNNLERIGLLVDTFRQAATGGPPPRSGPVCLRDCLADVVRSLRPRVLSAGVQVHIDCDPALHIHSHAGDWATVFASLIGNSVKHGFRGRDQGSIHVRVEADATRLRVHYRDDGCGMPPEVLAKVFEPFFTTDLQRGMGLGMHLVYNLVTQRFGGSIWCESKVGQGVTFFIEVPR